MALLLVITYFKLPSKVYPSVVNVCQFNPYFLIILVLLKQKLIHETVGPLYQHITGDSF